MLNIKCHEYKKIFDSTINELKKLMGYDNMERRHFIMLLINIASNRVLDQQKITISFMDH